MGAGVPHRLHHVESQLHRQSGAYQWEDRRTGPFVLPKNALSWALHPFLIMVHGACRRRHRREGREENLHRMRTAPVCCGKRVSHARRTESATLAGSFFSPVSISMWERLLDFARTL
eukprot:jgi/Mesvir1/767/Mv17368-RA.1